MGKSQRQFIYEVVLEVLRESGTETGLQVDLRELAHTYAFSSKLKMEMVKRIADAIIEGGCPASERLRTQERHKVESYASRILWERLTHDPRLNGGTKYKATRRPPRQQDKVLSQLLDLGTIQEPRMAKAVAQEIVRRQATLILLQNHIDGLIDLTAAPQDLIEVLGLPPDQIRSFKAS